MDTGQSVVQLPSEFLMNELQIFVILGKCVIILMLNGVDLFPSEEGSPIFFWKTFFLVGERSFLMNKDNPMKK